MAAVAQQFTQGNISVTNNPLDVAINGNGFFRMSNAGAVTYSRNGQFQMDKNGYIVNSAGLRLTGYDVDSAGKIIATDPVDIQLTATKQALIPNPTSAVNVGLNLDSRSTVPLTAPFNPTDSTSFNSSTSVNVYDSLGNSHVLSTYFVKSAAAPVPPATAVWDVYATFDGVITPALPAKVGSLGFTSSGLITPSGTTLSLSPTLANGATTPQTLNLNFTGSTQFGALFGVNTLTQDGFSAGTLAGFNVSPDGTILGRYTNGQSKNLGQVVLASFPDSQGLQPLGNNQWAQSPESGPPLVGIAGTGKLGVMQSAAVEDSNVDMTQELVNMITAQRIYQANAQTIKTQDQVLQTLVNLR